MPLTILLVDDDPLMHRMLAPRLAEIAGAPRVASAHSAERALDELARLKSQRVVVLTDFNLKTGLNGLQLLRIVREQRPDAMRVLFSGYSREQLGDVRSDGDAEVFLEKPLHLDDLVGPLEKLVAQRFG